VLRSGQGCVSNGHRLDVNQVEKRGTVVVNSRGDDATGYSESTDSGVERDFTFECRQFWNILLCMTSTHGISDLRAMLHAVRVQIELHEEIAKKGSDNELRKRIKKLKVQESVLLSKLRELAN
jgi:rubrerythrin